MDVRVWKGADGASPVEDWLRALPHDHLETALSLLARLRHFGIESMGRHSKKLTGEGKGLFELRDKISGIRIYYCRTRSNTILLLLAGGFKEEQADDIKTAQHRRQHIFEGDFP